MLIEEREWGGGGEGVVFSALFEIALILVTF